jgi:hypothetical protein
MPPVHLLTPIAVALSIILEVTLQAVSHIHLHSNHRPSGEVVRQILRGYGVDLDHPEFDGQTPKTLGPRCLILLTLNTFAYHPSLPS